MAKTIKYSLVYKDTKSNKYWEIDARSNSYTVHYGKAGTKGQSLTKAFSTNQQCIKEAEKLLNEKFRRGYKKNVTASIIKPAQPPTTATKIKPNPPNKTMHSGVTINEINVTADYPFYKDYNSEYVQLSRNRILEAQSRKVTIYERRDNEYGKSGSIDVALPEIGRRTIEIACGAGDVVLLFSSNILYVIDASGKVPSKPKRIALQAKWEHLSIYQDGDVYFFGNHKNDRGLFSLNIKKPASQKLVLSDVGELRAGMIWQDKFFLAHHERFTVASPVDQPSIIHKKQMSFAWPKVVPIDPAHIIIFDQLGAYGRAAVVFNVSAKPEKIQEILKTHSAKLWLFEKNDLWLFTKKGANQDTCFFSHYRWNGKQFIEQFSKKLPLPARENIFRYLERTGSTFRITGSMTGQAKPKRIVWELKIDS